MKFGDIPAPPRHAIGVVPATAPSDKKAVNKKNGGATRPPTHVQRTPARATTTPNGAAPMSDVDRAEKYVRDLVLAFFRRPDVSRLYSRERALLADLSSVVRQLVSERDGARLEALDARMQVERAHFSSAAISRWERAHNGRETFVDVEELEEKPEPTMWQLIAAGYSNDPELADAWSALRDDPAFADLHEPEITSLATQMHAQLRLDSE